MDDLDSLRRERLIKSFNLLVKCPILPSLLALKLDYFVSKPLQLSFIFVQQLLALFYLPSAVVKFRGCLLILRFK